MTAEHPPNCCCPHHPTSDGVSPLSLIWLLLLLAAGVAVYKAEVVNSIATAVVLAVCAIPALWLLRQACGELRYSWEARRYTPVPRRLAITTRVPLAIEAARPVTPLVIEHEGMRMER